MLEWDQTLVRQYPDCDKNINDKWILRLSYDQLGHYLFISILLIADFENDNNICLSVSNNPRSYTVPHPSDYSKFYMCQEITCSNFKGKCWIAHLMHCPMNTGFDTTLKACNWMSKHSSNRSRGIDYIMANERLLKIFCFFCS